MTTEQEADAIKAHLPERFQSLPAHLIVSTLDALVKYHHDPSRPGQLVQVQSAGEGNSHVRYYSGTDAYQHSND
jgi:hypothetical protein